MKVLFLKQTFTEFLGEKHFCLTLTLQQKLQRTSFTGDNSKSVGVNIIYESLLHKQVYSVCVTEIGVPNKIQVSTKSVCRMKLGV